MRPCPCADAGADKSGQGFENQHWHRFVHRIAALQRCFAGPGVCPFRRHSAGGHLCRFGNFIWHGNYCGGYCHPGRKDAVDGFALEFGFRCFDRQWRSPDRDGWRYHFDSACHWSLDGIFRNRITRYGALDSVSCKCCRGVTRVNYFIQVKRALSGDLSSLLNRLAKFSELQIHPP